MKVLFKKLVVNVGHPWDIKEVKTWYAMNCLFPQWLAIELTPQREKQMKSELKNKDKHNRDLIANRHAIAETLNNQILHFSLKTWAHWKVFWWIGEKDIIQEIKKHFKVDITKKHIELTHGHLKKLWESAIYIKLWKDSMAKMTAHIEAES